MPIRHRLTFESVLYRSTTSDARPISNPAEVQRRSTVLMQHGDSHPVEPAATLRLPSSDGGDGILELNELVLVLPIGTSWQLILHSDSFSRELWFDLTSATVPAIVALCGLTGLTEDEVVRYAALTNNSDDTAEVILFRVGQE